MVAQKEMLPQSTERIVEVQGTPEGIDKAVWEIGKCLVDDWQRGTGTVLYNPAVRVQVGTNPLPPAVGGGGISGGSFGAGGGGGGGRPFNRTGNGADFSETAKKSKLRTSASLPIWSAALLEEEVPRLVRSARALALASPSPKHLMTTPGRGCSPSWEVPAPTNVPCTSSTKTLRLKKAVASKCLLSK